jgi:hypothetical protein
MGRSKISLGRRDGNIEDSLIVWVSSGSNQLELLDGLGGKADGGIPGRDLPIRLGNPEPTAPIA